MFFSPLLSSSPLRSFAPFFFCQLVTVGSNGPGEPYRELWSTPRPEHMPERMSEYMSECQLAGITPRTCIFRCHESVMVSFGIWGRGRTFSECLGTGLRTREFLTCRVGKPPRFGGFIVVHHFPIFPLCKWPCG